MEIGKIPETVLKRSVFKLLDLKRPEILIGPGVGEDCSVFEVQDDQAIVLSTDPITGTAENIGKLAIHITLNDIAASGATPIGVMVTILLPPETTELDLKNIMKDINSITSKYDVQVMGGHTEVTDVVSQAVITVTGVGKIAKNRVMKAEKLKPHMDIVMTKWAGIEGTVILAKEAKELIDGHYHSRLTESAMSFEKYLSVVEDSKVAMKFNVYAMHDVTEGGIDGALWEIAAKSGLGIHVNQEDIAIRQETIEICEFLDLNPYRLISSGSLLIVTDQSFEMLAAFREAGIQASRIGCLTTGNDKDIYTGQTKRSLEPPQVDELYKGLKSCQEKMMQDK